jgi:hypothetical protein
MISSIEYDAHKMARVLEPFRMNVGVVEVEDEVLAALMQACCRNGQSLEQASATLNSYGVGLPPATMIYLQLDMPRPAGKARSS